MLTKVCAPKNPKEASMHDGTILEMTLQALLLVLMLSLPPILVAAGVGLLVSLLQALTQVQEQTISFALKLIATMVTLILTAHWLGAELYTYTDRMFSIFPYE